MPLLNKAAGPEMVTVTLPAEQLTQLLLAAVYSPEVSAETFRTIREAIFKRMGIKND